MDMATHWHSNTTSTIIKWTKALAAATLLASSTVTWAQIDITNEIRTSPTDCLVNPLQPQITLRATEAIKGINPIQFAGSGGAEGGRFTLGGTFPFKVTRELSGSNVTIVRAIVGEELLDSSQRRSCFVADIPFENPGTNEVIYIVELFNYDRNFKPTTLVSRAEVRARFEVPVVTYPAPALSTWALLLLAALAAVIGACSPNLPKCDRRRSK
jgi:hypothetical protein